MSYKFVEERKPTPEEKDRGAEVIFVYTDDYGNDHNIMAAKCYESFEQWGAYKDLLWQNVERVEKWRKSLKK